MKTLTKHQLSDMLYSHISDGAFNITDSRGGKHYGLIESVQKEDGSGSSFNITMIEVAYGNVVGRGRITFHVRTID